MITKNKFVEIIDRLREASDFVDETNDRARELNDGIISDFFNASSLSISHESIVLELLENMFNADDTLSWWLYDLNYGREYKEGIIQDVNGRNIDLSTAEKLYDFLIDEMGGTEDDS